MSAGTQAAERVGSATHVLLLEGGGGAETDSCNMLTPLDGLELGPEGTVLRELVLPELLDL